MGSDSSLIAVASIPPRIWERDKETWKAWYYSLTKASSATKQQYKRYIADFLYEVNKSITEVTEQDIAEYERGLQAVVVSTSVANRMRPIRAYWKFAKQNLPRYLALIAESLHRIEYELSLDMSAIRSIEITSGVQEDWWIDINGEMFAQMWRYKGQFEIVLIDTYEAFQAMHGLVERR